ncbi:MAG: FAD-dependent monooxygenase [Desulfobacterota bacterium]|nr:FAD-dependent monooxygenase [Thermodesulfobacteriota bacterium]
MKERYDVVVVGAGPAGLLAAKALGENGFDVAVIERKKDLAAVTRACGQSLLPPNEYFFGDIFHYNEKDKRFCFPLSGLSFPYTGPIKPLYTWHMFSPAMKRMQFGYGPQQGAPIALSYDKEVMLQSMIADLPQNRVELFPATEYTGLIPGQGALMVQAGEQRFSGSCVIAADGANSRVVQHLGYNTNRRHIATLYVTSYFITGFTPPYPDSIITAITTVNDKPVYLFLLPRPTGEEWNFILLTLEPSVDLTKTYDAITRDKRYASWFANARRVRDFAATEYIYSPILRPFRNNVLVLGDAAACQELECLGAMLSGWKGGLAIAAALKEQQLGVMPRAVALYEDWWLNTYIKQYDYQEYLSVFGIAYMFARPDIIDYIFERLGTDPFPPTFNPYTATGLLGNKLQAALPAMLKDRPDIVQQLAATMFRFPSDVIAAAVGQD